MSYKLIDEIIERQKAELFRLMAEISGRLGRDVDLYQMETIDEHLRRRIEERGTLWKKED